MAVDDRAGGEAVPGGARLRVLLAALLLRANVPVSRGALAEAVWDGTPPPGAEVSLRGHVLRLRRALGPEAGARIAVHDPGYLIRLAPSEIDVLEFEALCRDAGAALRAADWEQASAAGARAVALWRGEPLLDVPSQTLRAEFIPRLERLLVQVREDCIEADLELGRHDRLVPQLQELTATYPLRERFHAQLMLALARGGRRAEALEAYQHARRVLVDQLGIDPGHELRALHGRILDGEADPITARAAAPHEFAPAQAAPRQLPAAPGYFTGRQAELDQLVAIVQSAGTYAGAVVISAIDGMAGIGKTALAIHAAHRLAAGYPDGQLFIDLHGFTQGQKPRTADQALDWMLRTLGVPPGQIPREPEQAAALYRQRLADTKTLIVLDNAAVEAQVRPLLPGAEGCLVLVTSRRRLKALDDAHSVSLDVLAAPDAVTLLRAVSGPGRVPEGDPRAEEVAQLCGYLPIALRIAAALLRHRPAWSIEQLAGLLREQHRLIPALSDGDRDLGTVFDLSYRSLTADLQRVFRRLGLLPGPDLDAYATAAVTGTDPAAAAGLLEDLVDHNLLIAYAPGRYRLHDLIRAHARALSSRDPRPELTSALDRLLHYYAHTAQRASLVIARYPRIAPDDPVPAHAPDLTDPDAARAWLRAERENLEAAHSHARALALDEQAVALAAGLAEILRTDGPFTRAVDLHRSAADTAERHSHPAAQASALVDLGSVRRLTGELAGAEGDASQALEIFRAIGHRHGEAVALTELGSTWRQTGELPRAGAAASQALEIFRAIGHRHGEAVALTELGSVRHLSGDLPGAAEALSGALEIFREAGNRHGEAYALTDLGSVWHLSGDLPRAGEALTRALEIYRETGNRNDEAWALNYFAAVAAAADDLARAIALYHQALTMNRELNKPDDEAVALEGLGQCHLTAGETEPATARLRQALEIFQRLGMRLDAERVQTCLRTGLTRSDTAVPR